MRKIYERLGLGKYDPIYTILHGQKVRLIGQEGTTTEYFLEELDLRVIREVNSETQEEPSYQVVGEEESVLMFDNWVREARKIVTGFEEA